MTSGLLILGLVLIPMPLWAEDAAEAWLEQMSKAMAGLNYEGELVYQHGDQIKVLQLIHTVRQGRERERLISLNGVPREVIRDQDAVRCVRPSSQAVSVDRRGGSGYGFPSLQPLTAHELGRVYRMRLAGQEARVAGRLARRLDIQPLDGYRYGHRLYLDEEYRLPLKQEVLDHQGQRVSLIMYSRIKVDPGLPFEASQASPLSKDFSLIEYRPRQKVDGEQPEAWGLSRLPPGFHISHRDFRQDEGGISMEHLVLSDGLASVSLYLEPARPDNHFDGPSRLGAVSIHGRRLQDRQILVIGEVPQVTTRFIAEAVELR
ncbi:MAG: MucB/RseB C-terminal domain-containing protein [Gammaproteobacteria bacterium SHHR-1]